jgi:general secretion pathway protein A
MYTKFYGFKEQPFKQSPDPRFLYLNSPYRAYQSSMGFGINEKRGLLVIIGETGIGKTTLINGLLNNYDQKTKSVLLLYSILVVEGSFSFIFDNFGIEHSEKDDDTESLIKLNKFLSYNYPEKGNAVLVIDEAQDLKPNLLNEIQLLSNLVSNHDKLFQILLVGHPELENLLDRSTISQVGRCISLHYELSSLSCKKNEEYINYRLRIAGRPMTKGIFSPGAIDEIYLSANGNPMAINDMCNKALQLGSSSGIQYITREMVKVAKNIDKKYGTNTLHRPASINEEHTKDQIEGVVATENINSNEFDLSDVIVSRIINQLMQPTQTNITSNSELSLQNNGYRHQQKVISSSQTNKDDIFFEIRRPLTPVRIPRNRLNRSDLDPVNLNQTVENTDYDSKQDDKENSNQDEKISNELNLTKTEASHHAPHAIELPEDVVNEFKMIKHKVEQAHAEKNTKIIAITSSVPEEGRSSIAYYLALMLSQSQNGVYKNNNQTENTFDQPYKRNEGGILLIDGNIQKPKLHQFFGIDQKQGLSRFVLTPHPDAQVASQNVYEGNLNLYTPSIRNGIGADIWSTEQIKDVMRNLRTHFEYILIDAPPIMGHPETLSLCALTDGILLVVKANQTRWRVIDEAKNKVQEAGAKILGVVFNKRKFFIPDAIYKRL